MKEVFEGVFKEVESVVSVVVDDVYSREIK
jgi:hypothetical protein